MTERQNIIRSYRDYHKYFMLSFTSVTLSLAHRKTEKLRERKPENYSEDLISEK